MSYDNLTLVLISNLEERLMFTRNFISHFIVILLVFAIAGCSGGGAKPVAPDVPGEPLNAAKDVIDHQEGAMKESEPMLWFTAFDDSSINFRLRVACRDYVSTLYVQHELIKRLHKRFDEENIVIPFPLRTIDFQPQHIKLFRELAGSQETDA